MEYDHRASLAGIRGDKQRIEFDKDNRLINILPRKRNRSNLSLIVALLAIQTVSAQERSPAVPLVVHNPYFSIWSMADRLTGEPTRHWTGAPQPIEGIARIDGKAYRFMGQHPDTLPAMLQTSNTITPTQTQYKFREGGVQLRLEFFTPAIMSDLDVLSRPVTYLTWRVQATDGGHHRVSVLFDVDPLIAVNDRSQPIVTSRHDTGSLNVLSVGSRDQNILNRSGDDLRIEWGYFHLAAPKNEQAKTSISAGLEEAFIASGQLASSDSICMPEPASQSSAHLDVVLDLGSVGSTVVARHVLLSYTEGFAIQYFQRNLRPYWQRNNMAVEKMLDRAEEQYSELEVRGSAFDSDLTADLVKVGGKHYAAIAILAYRKTLAAHALVADLEGQPMLFAKENFSNGCIATVDVLYPSAPFFLLFQPKLLEAQLLPVLEYSALPRWRFPFAPHDLGQYPLANGQVYGGGETSEQDQMPVEESGNMLILVDALARAEGNIHLAEKYWTQLTSWAEYLKQKGLDPDNQLTTDDFAGHVAHNANLSIKAIDALAAYADLARLLHHGEVAAVYSDEAKGMAAKWIVMAKEGDHYKLAFNSPGTWSQKYNLVWDKIMGYELFPPNVEDTEVNYYVEKLNRYGLPLDSRAGYTKLDWSLWTATLASKQSQFEAIVDPIYKWMNETQSRVPLTDWYDTTTGLQVGFQARSVVGGVFIKALSDPTLVGKWRAIPKD